MNRRNVLVSLCGSVVFLTACQTTSSGSPASATPAIKGPAIALDVLVHRPEVLDDIGWQNVKASTRLPVGADGSFTGEAEFDDGAQLYISGKRQGSNVDLKLSFERNKWIPRSYEKTISLTNGSFKSEEKTNGQYGGTGTSGNLLFALTVHVSDA